MAINPYYSYTFTKIVGYLERDFESDIANYKSSTFYLEN